MREIADGVFFEDAYASGNVGCVMTTEGAVIIDAPMLPEDAWDWLKQNASRLKQGLLALINTDGSLERVLGNGFFPPCTTIAHQSAWQEMQHYDQAFLQRQAARLRAEGIGDSADLNHLRIVPPELTMTTSMTLHKGDRELRLLYGGGHSSSSIMVHLPKERILFTGNILVCGEHPALAQATTAKWLSALEMIHGMPDVEAIVPGSGGICDQRATETLATYILQMRERVEEFYNNGYTRRETVDRVKMEDYFPIPETRRNDIERRVRGSVERVYDELKRGSPKKHP